MERRRRHDDVGSAVADFVLVMLVVVPLVLGIMQVAIVLHVRNTLTSAASEGARTSAVLGGSTTAGADRARSLIRQGLSDRYADDVSASFTTVAGVPGVEVRVRTSVPALGLFGPSMSLSVSGHAVREVSP